MDRRRIGFTAAAVLAAAVSFGAATRAGGGSSAQAAPAAPPPTWKDVAPLFAAKCASCHTTGGIAPFPLTSAGSAVAHAQAIFQATKAGVMPPWMPGPDSPALLGSDRRILTAAEKATIAAWVRGGAKRGSGGAVKAPPDTTAVPGGPLLLTPEHPYLPRAAGGGMDDYHCTLLDPKLTQDAFVTSAVVKPQHAEIVHHVILFEAAGANAGEARRLDAASGGKGWTCFGGPGLAETRASADNAASDRLGSPQWISAWVPGHTTNALPSGTGVLLHSGALVVMQVHYNLMHGAKADLSRVLLHVAPAATTPLTPLDTLLVPAPVELPCPAGATGSKLCTRDAAFRDEMKKYGQDAAFIPVALLYLCKKTMNDYPQDVGAGTDIRTSCDRAVNRPIRIYGVAGHMHTRGFDIRVELNPGTPTARTLLHIPRWNFHWQDAYYLASPVDAAPGDTIRVSCRFDNSRSAQPMLNGKPLAPRYVLWGEGTTDEMCLGLLQVATRP